MPVNIIIGIAALLVALVLYSMGTIGAFRARSMSPKHMRLIVAGLLFDVLATTMMAIQIGGIGNDLHTYLALIGFFGMLAAGLLGARAVSKGNAAMLAALSRWTLVPYVLWVGVFVWGMVQRGSVRMG